MLTHLFHPEEESFHFRCPLSPQSLGGWGGVHHVTWLFVSINDPVIVPLTAGIGRR